MSEDADEASKTEEPTQKKLRKAEEEGNFPLSKEIANWMTVAVGVVILVTMLPGIMLDLQTGLAFYIGQSDQIIMDFGGVGAVAYRALWDVIHALWLPVLLLLIGGVSATVVQKGWKYSWKTMEPKLEKISPLAGIKRMFSLGSQSMEFGKSVAKLAVVGVASYLVLLPMFVSIEHFVGMDIGALLEEFEDLVFLLMVSVLAVLTVIAAADVIYQRYSYTKKMKMTKQEVKDEHKQAEGDPQVKARIRQIRFQRARDRMMSSVPSADVVVTNPTHFAVALKYDTQTMNAPTVVAKGADLIALKIREVAEENDVPIVENPPLARALFATVEIDQEVPSEHYRAVAEVITYVYKLKRRTMH